MSSPSLQRSWSRRLRPVAGGTAIGVVNSALGGTRSIILLPLLLSVWGKDVVGLWLVFRSIFAWFSLGDLGFTDPTQIMFSRWDPDNDTDGRQLFGTSLLAFGLIGVGLGLLATAGAWVLPWGQLLHVGPALARQAEATFAWGGLAMGLWVAGRLPEAIMIGLRQSPKAGAYRMAAIVLSLLTICACLLSHRSLALTFALSIMVEVAVAIVQLLDLVLKHRCFRFRPHFDGGRLKELLAPSGSFLTLKITGLVFAQTGVLIISHFHGPAAVTGYAVTLRLAVLWYMPASVGTVLLQPEVAPHWDATAQRFRSLASQFETGMLVSTLVGFVLAFGYLATARPTEALLLNRGLTSSWPTLGAFATLVFVLTVYTYGCTFVHAALQVKTEARLGWLLVATNLGLAVVLVPYWGGFGAALAALVGYAVSYAWYLPWKAAALVSGAVATHVLAQIGAAAVALVVAISVFIALISHSGWAWWLGAALLPAEAAILLLWAWRRQFSESNRAMVLRLLRSNG